MDDEINIEITTTQLCQWILCCENLRRYAANEHHLLLDTVQDRSGHRIKIYLDKGK